MKHKFLFSILLFLLTFWMFSGTQSAGARHLPAEPMQEETPTFNWLSEPPAVAQIDTPSANALPEPAVSPFTLRHALELDGVNDYVLVPHHPALNPVSEITLDAWVYRYATNRCETVIGKNFQQSYWLGFCNNKIRFYPHGSGSALDGIADVPAQTWTHIAVTYDGTTRRYYINGELDFESTALNGPLTSSTSDLGIGFDPATSFTQNYFWGRIDEVNIWNEVRTQSQIARELYVQRWPRGSGMVARYLFQNAGNDSSGYDHDGTLQGGVGFTSLGAGPVAVSFYHTPGAVTVDGQCQPGEYAGLDLVDIGSGSAYLGYDGTYLVVCLLGIANGGKASAAVSFDPLRDGATSPQNDDYRFTLDVFGIKSIEKGNGVVFEPVSVAPGSWDAAGSVVSPGVWNAEFRFDPALMGISLTYPQDTFNFLLQERIDGVPPQYFPGAGRPDQPYTWASTRFSTYTPVIPSYTLTGNVLDEQDASGIPDVQVELSYELNGVISDLAVDITDSNGSFSFTTTVFPGGRFLIQAEDKAGYFSVAAQPAGSGDVLSPNLVSQPAGQERATFSGITFLDSKRPEYLTMNKKYLIVYSAPVSYRDIFPLVDFKRMQGFQVETNSTQAISSTVAGRDLPEKIRNWIKGRWEDFSPNPVYVLLIGRHDVIPVREVGWLGDLDHREPGPNYFPALITDWYYADLNSNWDTDNDGWYGEFLYCAPWIDAVPLEGADLPGRCPPEGHILREGPYGTSPSTSDDWRAEVALGRLPLNSVDEVRRGISTILHGESSAALEKRKALLAAGFWWYAGRGWDPDTSTYVNGVGRDILQTWPGVGARPYGSDNAEYMETQVRPQLSLSMDTITTLYETSAPSGGALAPSARAANFPLLKANVETQIDSGYGLVALAGHGDANGVYHSSWLNDRNNNQIIDNPVNPLETSGCTTCFEISSYRPFFSRTFDVNPPVPMVVFANACLTGDAWENFPGTSNPWRARANTNPSTLIPAGEVAAWSGSLGIVPTNVLNNFNTEFFGDIVNDPLLLGDAQWKGMENLIRINPYDWRLGVQQLFGDPAYAYWGNPLDMNAAWPQSGRDWFGSARSRYSGPVWGRRAWEMNTYHPNSSPVVKSYGNAVVGANGRIIKVNPSNIIVGSSIDLGVNFTFPPALTTDGLVAVSGGAIYSFDDFLSLRWQTSLGGLATGAPHVGPDGIIWVPTSLGMARITGSGIPEILAGGPASTPAVLDRNGAALWISNGNTLRGYWMTRRGLVLSAARSLGDGVVATMPVVGPDNRVYVGTNSGQLIQLRPFPFTPAGWTFAADGAITQPPAVGVDGTVYFTTDAGSVYAVAPDGTQRWRKDLGFVSPAALALDDTRLFLTGGTHVYALALSSGDRIWSASLGGAAGVQSAPAIGPADDLYITRADGVLVRIDSLGIFPAPSDLRLIPAVGGVLLEWSDNSAGESGFRIDVCDLNTACSFWSNTPPNAKNLLINQLPLGQDLYFQVRALGGFAPGGDYQEDSPPVISPISAALAPAPPAPQALSAMGKSSSTIELNWSFNGGQADTLSGFDILRGPAAGGPFTLIAAVAPQSRSYLDVGLQAGSTHFYIVRARSQGGVSTDSNSAQGSTRSLLLLDPTGISFTRLGNKIKIAWGDAAGNESGYRIERRRLGEAGYTLLTELPANSTEYLDLYPDLIEGKVEYRITAFHATGESPGAEAAFLYVLEKTYLTYLPGIRR